MRVEVDKLSESGRQNIFAFSRLFAYLMSCKTNTYKTMDQGLYSPEWEHDACGIGLVVNVRGIKSHKIVEDALTVLGNMMHRGAEGADGKSGDGAGITVQIPHEFTLLHGIPVPEKGRYGTGIFFFPKDKSRQAEIEKIIAEEVAAEGLSLMQFREVPVNDSCLGEAALQSEPAVRQIFVTGFEDSDDNRPADGNIDCRDNERRLYRLRKHIEKRIKDKDFYICSLSCKYLIYKGMLTSYQLGEYYPDLKNQYFTSGLALVHSRFSTNTFPSWKLAQPFRMLCHNGEINTIRGNRSWFKGRESVLGSGALGDIHDLTPVIQEDMSDSCSLDNVLEFLVMSGMSLPQAMSILVPESFNDKNPISEELKAFYEYHSILMDPWDGPAALLFTDGRYAGGMLDRNGLRPARYVVTKGDELIVASEVGVLPMDPAEIVEKGCLKPGKILMVDTMTGTIYRDAELKHIIAAEHPYRNWLEEKRVDLDKICTGKKVQVEIPDITAREELFGYGKEDIDKILMPMFLNASEGISAMGNDTPLAILSRRPQLLFNYFRQQFSQVTNPAIDPIREKLVMNLSEYIGRVGTGILTPDENNCHMVKLPHPVLTNAKLDLLKNIRYKGFAAITLPMLFEIPVKIKGEDENYFVRAGKVLENAVDALCKASEKAVDEGYNYIILSDRGLDSQHAAIPSLLATSAVHQHLLKTGRRVQTALIIESGEIRETTHAALLLSYGASAINPYMVFGIIDDLVKHGRIQRSYTEAENNYIEAIKKGLLKIMAKMGISTLRSYRGARIFESIGIGKDLLERHFGGGISPVGGIGFVTIARDAIRFHAKAFPSGNSSAALKGFSWKNDKEKSMAAASMSFNSSGNIDGIPKTPSELEDQGLFHYKKDGIRHAWTPEVIRALQTAVRTGSYDKFKVFSAAVDGKEDPIFIRDFLDFKRLPEGSEGRIPIDEVESGEEIIHHFTGAAMSFGAISKEAHEAIAIAMNSLGCRSNTGEGGEDDARLHESENGVPLYSKVRQVASGRFGVTAEYLASAEEIQIKVAQGAKPGEGGQLPGFKVDEVIAKTRHSVPGISLISPPPHHDVYSIEDLSQLIFDLKNVNPSAEISVKLASETGVGTIAAGVAKAGADIIVISGAEGGTGASPASSIRFAGSPAEIGLAETQQTLVKNGLRGEVRLQVDGQLKTARDIILTALLGAEEFGFGTALLIALGCVMDRKCNLNICPVGICTQNPELRKRFKGTPEGIVNYMHFLARGVREYLSEMGFRRLDDIVGRTDLLEVRPTAEVWKNIGGSLSSAKADGLDFSELLYKGEGTLHNITGQPQRVRMDEVLDRKIIDDAAEAIEHRKPVRLHYTIRNTYRSVGAMLGGEIARRYGSAGLVDTGNGVDAAADVPVIKVLFTGSAGQSFGAFLPSGVEYDLEGDTNDYFGKGLSGGRIVIFPPQRAAFKPEDNVIGGNTGIYGATSGEIFVNGRVGERFAVRNSGAVAVVEGTGNHCCEYMTGGRVVVLGSVGRNFAAGMSGGIAYIWNPHHDFDYFCNMDLVEISLVDEPERASELHSLLKKHYASTGSPLAERLLDSWDSSVQDFIQVIPSEYKALIGK